jgi:hypothetical protein
MPFLASIAKLVILCTLYFVSCGAQGCATDYVLLQGRCYYFSTSEPLATYTNSKVACEASANGNGWLATIDTTQKWDAVTTTFSFDDTTVTESGVYFGLRKIATSATVCDSRVTCTGNVYWDSPAGIAPSSTTGYFLSMDR